MTSASMQTEGYFLEFQYRKRYEVTCDCRSSPRSCDARSSFQYRKRYEVTCDDKGFIILAHNIMFQYRKRYEVTCDVHSEPHIAESLYVSIPQAV